MIGRIKTLRQEKGVALLWALITIGVLLAIAGSMAGLIIEESRMSTGIDSSVRAYAAAESGIEHGTHLTSDPGTTYPFSQVVDIDPASGLRYTLEIDYADPVYTIQSTGVSGTTTRKIVKKIDGGSGVQPSLLVYDDPSLLLGSFVSDDIRFHTIENNFNPNISFFKTSYTQLFTVETHSNMTGGDLPDFGVGLGKFINADFVIAKFIDQGMGNGKLVLDINGDTNTVDLNLENDTRYKVYVEYIEGLVAKVTVKRISVEDNKEVENCVGIVSNIMPGAFLDSVDETFRNVTFYYDDLSNKSYGIQVNGTTGKIQFMKVKTPFPLEIEPFVSIDAMAIKQ